MYGDKIERKQERERGEREQDERRKWLRKRRGCEKKKVRDNDNRVIEHAQNLNRHIHKARVAAVNHGVAAMSNGAGERLMETLLAVDIERN